MDTPEQPTIWPPPPTIAVPEAQQALPLKIKLSVPAWLVNALKNTAFAAMILWGVEAAVDLLWHQILHHKPLHYPFYAVMLVIGFMAVGLARWRIINPKH